MGKNNKARRAAKAKTRARGRPGNSGRRAGPGSTGHPPVDGAPPVSDSEIARELLLVAATESRVDRRRVADVMRMLRDMPSPVVDGAAEAALLAIVGDIWAGGWQPAELLRQGRLGCSSAAGARLVALAMATDHAGRRSTTLDARWVAQVEGLGLPTVNGRGGWIARWAQAEGRDRTDTLAIVVDAIGNLAVLPRLEPILPPPGASGGAGPPPPAPPSSSSGDPRGAETDPMLVRIRALLAKAESTTFEAEAMAFTAKAQELMTRHAIDASLLQNGAGSDEQPVMVRLPVDAPYADVKSLLLQTVAEVGRCRAVFHSGLAMSTVTDFLLRFTPTK